MSSKFLDPASNAKSVGFFLIIIGLLYIFISISEPISLFIGAIYIATGYGFRTLKKWALYLLGFVALVNLIQLLLNITSGTQFGISLLNLIVSGGLFIWFYQAKDKFK